MNMLLFFITALLLAWALVRFARVRNDRGFAALADPSGTAGRPEHLPAFDDREFQHLGDAIFSERDWNFIQKESSPSLERLFLQERRGVARHWLNDSVVRIRSIRAGHLRNSKYSENLEVFAEVKLLLLFVYLIALCQCLLLVVRFARPDTPRSLALHFQRTARRLMPVQEESLAKASGEGSPR